MDLKQLMPFSSKERAVDREQRFDHPLASMQEEMNRLLERFFGDLGADPFVGRAAGFSPRMNIAESETEFLITVEVPGLDEKYVDITVTKDVVTIKGDKRPEQTTGYLRSERAFGTFTRTVPLPREVDQEKAEARIRQGVLTVILPKKAPATGEKRKISIRTD